VIIQCARVFAHRKCAGMSWKKRCLCASQECAQFLSSSHQTSAHRGGRSAPPPHARCARPRAGRGQRPVHSAFPRVPRAPACAQLLKRHPNSPRRHAASLFLCLSLLLVLSLYLYIHFHISLSRSVSTFFYFFNCLFLYPYHTNSHAHTHSHISTHTHTFSLALSNSHSLSLSFTHTSACMHEHSYT